MGQVVQKSSIAANADDSSLGRNKNIVETVACKVDEMKDGEMRIIDLGEGKALLVKEKGEFYAVGHKCTHFGAQLDKGAYSNGRVRCPWHGACFNVKTGDIEDFPGLDSIAKFEVIVKDGEVKVRGDKKQLENFRRTKDICKINKSNKTTVVVVGGGGASSSCVETLRQEGFTGKIILLTGEPHLPYDRTKLSKMMDSNAENILLRKQDTFKNCGVEVKHNKKVIKLDAGGKILHLEGGETLKFDKVVFATGGNARNLGIPGSDLNNVRLLRNIEDGNYIAKNCNGKKVVVVGTSFVGLEVAAFMLDKGKAESVTIVGRSEVPLKHVLGEKIGICVRNLLEKKGAVFVFKNPPKEFVGEDGSLKAVVLEDGTKLDADMCVVGAGVTPSTDYLKDSGVELSPEGYVVVNKRMQTSNPDVFAAGDITKFPLFMIGDESANIQHWQMAIKQGAIAAQNVAGKEVDIRSVPFFWTQLFGKGIRYAGYGGGHDAVTVHGSMEDYKFIAYYTKGNKVVAVATMGSDPIAAQAAEMFFNDIPFTKEDIKSDSEMPPAWTKKLVQ